jgi:predicted DNA-binding transcriptional regulator AlpA
MALKFLTTVEAASLLSLSPHTLIKWRALRKGPRVTRFGARVRYRSTDVEAWTFENREKLF